MRLARKLTIALALAIFAVMAAYAYLQSRQEVVLFDADVHRSRWFGRGAAAAVQYVWERDGNPDAAINILEAADRGNPEVKMTWRWLDKPPPDASSPPLSPTDLATLARGDTVIMQRAEPDDLRRYTIVPVAVAGQDPAAIEFSESLKKQLVFFRTSRRAIAAATLAITAACALVAAALGFWFVGRPVSQLRDKARRIAAADFSGPLSVSQHDEIGELATEINLMSERIRDAREQLTAETEARIRAVEQLRHADRLATVGQLASGIGHELGTPLNVVSARAKMIIAAGKWNDAVPQNARIIAEQADRMTGIIGQLMDFSRQRRAQLGPTDLRQIVTKALDLVSSAAADARVNVIVEGMATPVMVEADANQIEQTLTNLLMNGIHAMPDGGRLTLSTARRRARPPATLGYHEEDYVVVTVTDEGTGIAPENVPRLFEPFFTTKGAGKGTGLGLSVAQEIVAEHGGWIAVETELGKGTTFHVFLRPTVAPAVQLTGRAS
jgi:signal transduction histidine kinase